MIVKDIISSVYLLSDNCSEEELDYAVVLEQLLSVLNLMRQEQVLGALDDIITKSEVSFTDDTGIATNTLTNFGDVVYLSFNDEPLNECPVGMLDQYKDQGVLRVAFWKDAVSAIKYIQLSVPVRGILKVWYEPDTVDSNVITATVNYPDSLRMCVASRVALACIPYIHFQSEHKMINKPVLYEGLKMQSKEWKEIYLDRANRIGLNKPFTRTPFMAY